MKIVNVFAEEKGFDLVEYLKKENPDFVCLDLHWHFQSEAVIEAARKIKQSLPNAKIVAGGFTASCFSKEITEKFDFIDFVVKGDAEIPLLNIVEGRELSKIPAHFVAGKEILETISFTNYRLLSNYKKYLKFGLAKDDRENKWFFIYNAGRGCPVNCSFCSGSCLSQKKINNREKVVFADIEKALEEVKSLAKLGLGVWYTSFDPYPDGEYYLRLFKRIREEKLKLRCKFECWGLPSPQFIDLFAETFEKGSEIVISPETGAEKIRERNKGYYYDNSTLLDCISYLMKKEVGCVLYFTAGLPYETMDDFAETLILVNFIRQKFPKVKITALPIEMEPNSPWFLDGKKYGVKTKRKTFSDFYEAHRKKSSIGYETENFSEQDILELVSLINAEAGCRIKKSLFTRAFTETTLLHQKPKLGEVHRLCQICRFYNNCFA
ncbi:radical SAM protein [Candidatus Woesearchaeota archaeon]|nr:radical SAM protein [Candidatus Woesearchaeota archaeon]